MPPSPYRRGAAQGLFFGIYLSILFLASVYSVSYPLMGLVGMLLVLGVPFYIYRCLRATFVADGGLTPFSSLWMQGIMVFLCGALIQGVVAVIYLKWVDPTFIITQLRTVISFYDGMPSPEAKEMAKVLSNMIEANLVPSAASMVVEMIFLSVFSGSLLSLLMSALARIGRVKRPPTAPPPMP